MKVLGGCMMLAALLGLEAWFASSVARDWPRVTEAGCLQAPVVDVAVVFGTR
jgi:hypothetical protein